MCCTPLNQYLSSDKGRVRLNNYRKYNFLHMLQHQADYNGAVDIGVLTYEVISSPKFR